MSRNIPLSILLGSLLSSPLWAGEAPQSHVVAADAIEWGYLNPLRGELSPGAADLWGDRTVDGATGMLVRFNKGFSSPPHIHNITYRGVVIDGLMHNADAAAPPMWLPSGSFWTQPIGQDHITAANGDTNLIYLEIDSGPYLVKPSDEQFDNGERPINLHASNRVWLGAEALSFVDAEGAELALLWGSHQIGETGGALLKLPAGFDGQLSVDAEEFRAVVISGQVHYRSAEQEGSIGLLPGSYAGSKGRFIHQLSSPEETVIYLRTDGQYRLTLH
ncbi:DUF4437 domain-containing protein [Ferrimonas pelagia]|uniref:DUF4437 domain-containing protein n=1 Tax=Ferrimonas pelagia TaxID=1177826 RepID=A0ABP9EV00_9GAMM